MDRDLITEWPATRAAGLQRLSAFVPRAGHQYAANRNADGGPAARTNVSALSPYLRHRLLTEEEVVSAVLARHSPQAAEKFVHEVLWRTYWKGWLELRPAVWTRFVTERDAINAAGGLTKAIAAAESGATGIDGFDDWARELATHGYLHNHARMWFASIWVFTLGLPWQAGADFFLRHLVDADAASNTLSWRWVAGLQTAGKTYLATADNIARYTDGRFRPHGLATQAIALTESPVPAAASLPALAQCDPRTPMLLLLTGEDFSPESVIAEGANIRGVHTVATVAGWPWGEQARVFVQAAAADAHRRATARFRCGGPMDATLDADRVIESARAVKAKAILTPYAAVGPVADALAAITPVLATAGLPLFQGRRRWDDLFWPRARKGFFPFKDCIPALLAEQGLRFD